jgi:hypothetical protein
MIMDINEIRNQFEEQFWLEHFASVATNYKGRLLSKSSNEQLAALAEHLVLNGYNAWTDKNSALVEISNEDYMFGLLSHE